MTLKKIEITTVRFVFEDEPNEEAKSTTDVQVFGNPEQPSKPKRTAPKPATKPKTARDGRRMWTDEDKADIIRRYQAGEGPKSIGDSLGVSRNAIQQIIHSAGVTEGRTGENLRKKDEPQPEADENEPV